MKQIIQEINCTVKNEKVLVACSTGVDSMTLLHLVMESLDRKQIYVAHVNHKKRAQKAPMHAISKLRVLHGYLIP